MKRSRRLVPPHLFAHFFTGLLQPPAISGDGAYLTWVVQVLALFIALSWFVPASLYSHYLILHGLPSPAPYRLAYSADCLVASILVTIVVAVVALMEWPALLLSRLDYFILTPLPISRTQLFLSKAAAIGFFMAVFILALTSFATVIMPGVAGGRWEPRGFFIRVLAYSVALCGTAFFTFLALFIIQGSLSAVLPRNLFSTASFLTRLALLLAVFCALPLLPYFPAKYAVAEQVHWLRLVPPAWFWGCGEWLLDTRTTLTGQLAFRGAIALPVSGAAAALLYWISYLQYWRFAAEEHPRSRAPVFQPARIFGRVFTSVRAAAVSDFVAWTLFRSREQMMSFLLSAGIGIALILESLVYLVLRGQFIQSNAFVETVVTVPLTFSFFAMLGLRRAFRSASEVPANWIFRFLESARDRSQQLNVAYVWVLGVGGVLPLIICLPLELIALGARGLLIAALEALLACTFAEYLLQNWRAIPFTCARNPARVHIIIRLVQHCVELALYSLVSSEWIVDGLRHPVALALFSAVLLATFVALHRRRLQTWGKVPLEFEEAPSALLEPLRLL